jgi:hypothetical protein
MAETGGRYRGLVKEIRGVKVSDELVLKLSPEPSAKRQEPVLSGIEVQAEGW